MAYVIPTAAALKARYAEFSGVPDERVTAYITDATRSVQETWLERDYAPAIMLLAAHLMLSEGAIAVAAGGSSNITTVGAIKSKTVGEVSVTYAGVSGAAGGGSGDAEGFSSTFYGLRFLALRRANFAGPMVA